MMMMMMMMMMLMRCLGQVHPTTVFCKISVRKSENGLEISIGWGRLKISRCPFHSCTIFEVCLINFLRFSEVYVFTFHSHCRAIFHRKSNKKQLRFWHFNPNSETFTAAVKFFPEWWFQKSQYYFVWYIKEFSVIVQQFSIISEDFRRLTKIP